MPDITATAGSASANSFVTEDEFATYLEGRLNVGTYTTSNKQKALIEATRDISLMEYNGERVDSTQALSWPRADCPNPDGPVIDMALGDELADFSETEIPDRIKNATCELALQYLKAGTTDIANADSSISVISESVGPISVTYAEPHKRAQGLARFQRVMMYVAPLLRQGGLEVSRV